MHKLILSSHAKLNLYLKVINKRSDNYHNIETLFERIGLSDKIILKARPDKKINIICKAPSVPKGNSNLCYRAAELLQDNLNVESGVDIEIIKNIPVAAGLGGGSSNAACVLLGLNKLWKLNLSLKRLAQLAASIGSDVPFFVYNTPFALGISRGETVRPLIALKHLRLWHILVVPKIRVSTPFIYRKWDAYSGLTTPKYSVKLLIQKLSRPSLALWPEYLFNSLQALTVRLYPEVRRVKDELASLGLKTILMSGSGPAVFGIVSSRKEAVAISARLKKTGLPWQVFLTRTA